jgi:putative N-acetyltransferase (TIGR04045 family)
MMIETLEPYVARTFLVKFATLRWEEEGARRLRQAVFCDEQQIFTAHDRDAIDAVAQPIVALSCLYGIPDAVVGTVRIHRSEPGVWWGSRLAVARPVRRQGSIGTGLIRLAVRSAHARGCETFLAHVQSQNVPLFEHLHWRALEQIELHGHPHHLMQADLDFYPPLASAEAGLVTMPGSVA